jgi:hypothetical protein
VKPTQISRTAALAAAAVLAATVLLAGCGASSNDHASAPEPAQTVSTSTPLATPTPTQTATPTHKASPTKPAGGNGDSAGDNEPATAGGGICMVLSTTEVGQVLSGTVKGAGLPDSGCEFTQSDHKAPAATFIETTYAPDKMPGAKALATSSVEGTPEDLTGIGDAAFVVTGTSFGQPDIQGAGAVKLGSRLINVSLDQNVGESAAAVRASMIDLLKLAVAQAS